MSVTIDVDPGACRIPTRIRVVQDEDVVRLEIESKCPMVKAMAEKLKTLDMMDCMVTPITENPIMIAAGETLKHASCPVPLAIIKAAEACCGLAVKKDVSLTYSDSSI